MSVTQLGELGAASMCGGGVSPELQAWIIPAQIQSAKPRLDAPVQGYFASRIYPSFASYDRAELGDRSTSEQMHLVECNHSDNDTTVAFFRGRILSQMEAIPSPISQSADSQSQANGSGNQKDPRVFMMQSGVAGERKLVAVNRIAEFKLAGDEFRQSILSKAKAYLSVASQAHAQPPIS
eukprot:ANDGO_01859.mRNA.1 hypothetical protein